MIEITEPRTLERVASTFLVRVDRNTENTVLHNWKERPELNIHIGDKQFRIDLAAFNLEPRTYFTEENEPVDVLELPDVLRVIDSLIGDHKAGLNNTTKRKNQLLQFISHSLRNKVWKTECPYPGLMQYALVSTQLEENEVGVSLRSLESIVDSLSPDFIRYLVYRGNLGAEIETRALLDRFMDPVVRRKLAEVMDGIPAYTLRYPANSDTSYKIRTLRVLKNSPAQAIFFHPNTLIYELQGDSDGDLAAIHLLPLKETKEIAENTQPNPLEFELELVENRGIGPEDIVFGEDACQVDLMRGFADRGRYIGILTYSAWMLCFAAAKYDPEGPAAAYSKVRDLFVPCVEGVMDARKGDAEEAENLAQTFLDVLQGQASADVLKFLPLREDPKDNKKFTKEHIEYIKFILAEAAKDGKDNIVDAAVHNPGLLLAAGRFKTPVVRYFLDTFPEYNISEELILSITHKPDALQWMEGQEKSLRELLSRAPLQDEAEDVYLY